MLISAVLPIMTLYRLPHGQYGYSGHVINLPQDITSLADKLPRGHGEVHWPAGHQYVHAACCIACSMHSTDLRTTIEAIRNRVQLL